MRFMLLLALLVVSWGCEKAQPPSSGAAPTGLPQGEPPPPPVAVPRAGAADPHGGGLPGDDPHGGGDPHAGMGMGMANPHGGTGMQGMQGDPHGGGAAAPVDPNMV